MMFLGVLYGYTLIEKAKCIFNTIVEAGDNGVTVASIITHVAKFGENWGKFPKTADEIKIVTSDKLDRRKPKYELICTHSCNRIDGIYYSSEKLRPTHLPKPQALDPFGQCYQCRRRRLS